MANEADYPLRGQAAPDFWDLVLKNYIDSGDADSIPLPENPTDGQLVSYSDALGEWVAQNPAGLSLNGAASNVSNTLSAAITSLTALSLTGTGITVKNSQGRRVILVFGATFIQTVVGAGTAWLALVETTSGVTNRRYNRKPLPNSIDGNASTIDWGAAFYDCGVVTTDRTFELRGALGRASGSAAEMKVINQPTGPSQLYGINL